MEALRELTALGDIALAALLAAVLGIERERARKPAGLRTHILVGVAVSLFVTVGNALVARAEPPTQPDPIRMLEAIATGVSFLGAGTIIFRKQRGIVEGLTTASSLLLVAAIAMAATVELRVLAVGVTIFALLLMVSLGALEKRLGWNQAVVDDANGDRSATRAPLSAAT